MSRHQYRHIDCDRMCHDFGDMAEACDNCELLYDNEIKLAAIEELAMTLPEPRPQPEPYTWAQQNLNSGYNHAIYEVRGIVQQFADRLRKRTTS